MLFVKKLPILSKYNDSNYIFICLLNYVCHFTLTKLTTYDILDVETDVLRRSRKYK